MYDGFNTEINVNKLFARRFFLPHRDQILFEYRNRFTQIDVLAYNNT